MTFDPTPSDSPQDAADGVRSTASGAPSDGGGRATSAAPASGAPTGAATDPTLETVRDPDRLAALERTGLLDTESEEGFDRLTRVAACALEVPYALVSLVDADRQFFKSCFGPLDEVGAGRETPLSHSFCKYVVWSEEELVLADAREHAAFRDNGAVRDLGLIAYAGIPIRDGEGRILGSFCAIDDEPHEWAERDLSILRDLAVGVSTEIALRAARDEARRANRIKGDFMAMISHELRTPLNAVIGYGELMEMGIPEPLPARAADNLEQLLVSADYLKDLVEQLLTFSQLDTETDTVEWGEVEVSALVREVRAITEPLAQEAGLALEIRVEPGVPPLHSDARKVRQILVNLVGNAIKFSTEGSVRLAVVERGGEVRFQVEDEGIGIAEDDLAHVFEPFWQVERPETRASSGTGLGLAIARRFAEALGGSLEAESEEGEGSVFTLTVPVRGPDHDPPHPAGVT